MKFIHIADVHLGAEPDAGPLYSEGRPAELWERLEHVIDICEEEQTDLLLIAGDLFHRQPLLRELKEVDALFSCLTHTRVVLIAGNHDYIRRDSYYRSYQWRGPVFTLFGREPEYIDFPDLGTAVYGLSYHSREIREPLYDRIWAGAVQPVEILLAHGGDEKHIPIDKRQLERSGFDYVALGHIHKPQAVLKNRAVYPGALEPVDSNDTGAHGYIRGEIRDGIIRTEWIPSSLREYIHLEIGIDIRDTMAGIGRRISELVDEYGKENIYKIALRGRRDPEIVFDTKWLRTKGNILEVSDHTEPAYDLEQIRQENRDNIIGQFISRFDGCEEGSVEYEALCEGVDALLGSRQ